MSGKGAAAWRSLRLRLFRKRNTRPTLKISRCILDSTSNAHSASLFISCHCSKSAALSAVAALKRNRSALAFRQGGTLRLASFDRGSSAPLHSQDAHRRFLIKKRRSSCAYQTRERPPPAVRRTTQNSELTRLGRSRGVPANDGDNADADVAQTADERETKESCFR